MASSSDGRLRMKRVWTSSSASWNAWRVFAGRAESASLLFFAGVLDLLLIFLDDAIVVLVV